MNSDFFQAKWFIISQIYDEIPVNTKHLKFPKNYKGQIRTHCLEKCPEDCRNENNWEYYKQCLHSKEIKWNLSYLIILKS